MENLVVGGRPFYGYKLGVLLLNTRFPRIVGDPGNAATYDCPVIFKVVEKATVSEIVKKSIDEDVVRSLVRAAKELEAYGVSAITTSCGFLALLQKDLATSVKVPVYTSTLLLIPLAFMATGKPVGILTANSQALTRRHFEAANVSDTIPLYVKGLEGKPEFRRVILQDSPDMNLENMRRDIRAAAEELISDHPEIGSVVCECTNLAPFREEVKSITGLPVYDYLALVRLAENSVS
ncbi:MAG: aspartate/glutamate racemase family protein [Candidatus Caldarchaeum sp.]